MFENGGFSLSGSHLVTFQYALHNKQYMVTTGPHYYTTLTSGTENHQLLYLCASHEPVTMVTTGHTNFTGIMTYYHRKVKLLATTQHNSHVYHLVYLLLVQLSCSSAFCSPPHQCPF